MPVQLVARLAVPCAARPRCARRASSHGSSCRTWTRTRSLPRRAPSPPPTRCSTLARAKAEEVARTRTQTGRARASAATRCSSSAARSSASRATPQPRRDRWRAMRGNSGTLHTGHWLIDARARRHSRASSPPRATGATSSTIVHFADLTDDEIDAYVATGEPLHVAGAFTVDGLGGPYVESIEGDLPRRRRRQLAAPAAPAGGLWRDDPRAPRRVAVCRRATTYARVTACESPISLLRSYKCGSLARSTASQTCSPPIGRFARRKCQALPLPGDCLHFCAHRQPRRDRSSHHPRLQRRGAHVRRRLRGSRSRRPSRSPRG